MFAALIGTWGCAPRAVHSTPSFTLTVKRVSDTTLGIQGMSIFPGEGPGHYVTLTRDANGDLTIDKGLVPYPYTASAGHDNTVVFARTAPSRDRLYWHMDPDGQAFEFVRYLTTEFQIGREEHLVKCTRTSSL